MRVTPDWTDKLDAVIHDALQVGAVSGLAYHKPDHYVESGLAHVFFNDDTVFKLYKTFSDKDHFIKGVLAPTKRRTAFLEQDYRLNQHFSKGIYRNRYSLYHQNDRVEARPYDGESIYVLYEMDRLDFSQNFHERLLRADPFAEDEVFTLGYETARALDEFQHEPPADISWYELATKRMKFLEQFVEWLPEQYRAVVIETDAIPTMYTHLETHAEEYQQITGDQLTVSLDNHDENIFIRNGKPHFIDLLPPMESWWYGVPWINLSNLMVNIEAIHSAEAAEEARRGFLAYRAESAVPEHIFAFVRAFSYLISIAHFGSLEGKEVVTKKYLDRLPEVMRAV